MAVADLVINVAVRSVTAPINAVTSGLDRLSTGVRRTMRTFRDFVIVGYGVRRGFDLLSRTIKKTFEDAGGGGTVQLFRLSEAATKFGADVGKTIQRSQTFQSVMESLIGSLNKGIDEDSQKRWAKAFDNVAIAALDAVASIDEGWHRLIDGIGTYIDGLKKDYSWFFGSATQKGVGAATTIARGLAAGTTTQRIGGGQPLDIDAAMRDLKAIQRGGEIVNPDDMLFGPLVRDLKAMAATAGGYRSPLRDMSAGLRSKVTENQAKQPGFLKQVADSFNENHWDKFNQGIDRATKLIEGMGKAWTDVMTKMGEEMFDKEVGVKQAFKNMGKNAGKTFVSQMAQATFNPLEQTFNMLANVAAVPFRIVGEAITNLLVRPVIDFLMNLLPTVFSTMAAQMTTAQAAGAAARAASLGEIIPYGMAVEGAMAPAAVAAAIASFGAANTFGIEAMAQIMDAAVPLADGGIVMPRPGGTIARIGEAGQPEAVIPLDSNMAAGLRGGNRIAVYVGSNVPSERQARKVGRIIGRAIEDQRRATSYGGRRDRRG